MLQRFSGTSTAREYQDVTSRSSSDDPTQEPLAHRHHRWRGFDEGDVDELT